MWIDVNEALPEMGEKVRVHGEHTPDGVAKPLAYRRADPQSPGGWRWESSEWRGTVGIAWWWRPEPGEVAEEVAHA